MDKALCPFDLKICLTRMGGKSFIIITPPRDFAKESPPFLRTLSHYTFNRLRKTRNPEQTKRRRETDERIEEFIATLLGSRASEMFYVTCVATEPASQGKGNASLLIQAAISHVRCNTQSHCLPLIWDYQANQSRRSIWLCTDSEANVKFYSMRGFETIGVTMVGDENPAWHGPPVILSLVRYSSNQSPIVCADNHPQMVHEHD
ncbi:hypothetical protein BD779DRAFT_1465844 [Infundibulicybe gibba]|nr:hypothetical protein BD779DRAFT_1465844 [Infundibulicybe gibba]